MINFIRLFEPRLNRMFLQALVVGAFATVGCFLALLLTYLDTPYPRL